MKKMSNWKRVLSLGLALVMTVSMTACGDKGNKGDGQGNGQGNGKGENTQAVNNALAKEHVFRGKPINIESSDNEVNVAASRKNGDEVEILTIAYVYGEYGESQNITLHKLKADGTVTGSVEMKLPDESAQEGGADEQEGQGENGTSENSGENQSVTVEDTEDGEIPVPVEDGEGDWEYGNEDYSYENTNYNTAVISDKNIFAFRNHYKDGYENGEYISENDQSICCWDKSGELLWMAPIDMSEYQNEEHYGYISTAVPLTDGSLGLILSGDQSGLIKVSADGTVSKLKKSSSSKDVFGMDPSFAVKSDGSLLVSYYNDDYSKQYLTTYDPATDQYGAETEVPKTARNYGFYNFSAGVQYDVVFSNSEGIFGFNMGDTDIATIMDYVNSDLVTYGLNNVVFLDENSFVASYNDPTDWQNHFELFTYVKPEDIPDKSTVLLAGVYVDMDQKTNIIRFNKNSDQYRIVVKDYSAYNTEEDFTQGVTRLNNDIIAGNVPDILYLNDNIPVDSLIAKGVLANIDELIKNDPELSQQEFMDNVFEAYRVDGVLYRVIPKFSVNTWIAKKSLVGDRTSWTMDEVKEAASKLTGKKTIFGTNYGTNTRDMFMQQIMTFCGNDFVDINTGKCNFDNKLFADLLEYAKTLPTEEENSDRDEDYWENYWQEYYTQYRENKVLMMPLEMYDFSNVKYQIKGMMGEAVSFVGFPAESGAGSFIGVNVSFAIADKSANKEGAWQFLRFFLSEDYQRNEDYKYGYGSGIPVLKKLAREQADKLKERPYWEDENGNKNYYDDTFWMNGESIVLDPFTQAEVDQLFDFVCSVKKAGFSDENVTNIVSEEAGSFFSGSKSAKDVAAMIQNRVQLYVNENR